MKDIKIEKLILLTTILFGLILFIDFVFRVSNLIHVYDKDVKEIHLRRNIFIHLYSVSLIPVMIFYGQSSSQRDGDKEPDIIATTIQPFMVFIILYKLLDIEWCLFGWINTELKIILIITSQFLFFIKPSFWVLTKIKNMINQKD